MNESLFSSGTETEMEADLVGRLNKLRDVKSYREPMLEAVANSIQAIEQGSVTNGEITIRIIWQDEEVLCQAQDNAIPLALSNSIPVIVKSILFGHAHCLTRGARKAVGVPVPRSNCLSSF